MEALYFEVLILLITMALIFLLLLVITHGQKHSSSEEEMLKIGNQARKEMDIESDRLFRDIFERFSESYEIDQKEIKNG